MFHHIDHFANSDFYKLRKATGKMGESLSRIIVVLERLPCRHLSFSTIAPFTRIVMDQSEAFSWTATPQRAVFLRGNFSVINHTPGISSVFVLGASRSVVRFAVSPSRFSFSAINTSNGSRKFFIHSTTKIATPTRGGQTDNTTQPAT